MKEIKKIKTIKELKEYYYQFNIEDVLSFENWIAILQEKGYINDSEDVELNMLEIDRMMKTDVFFIMLKKNKYDKAREMNITQDDFFEFQAASLKISKKK
ncbi:MAG: hypothetical protein ACOC3Z_01390 [Nanoarchaeota archaeon]